MSETFEKVLIKDDRIGCVTPQVKFGVFKGGQNVTAVPFKAISHLPDHLRARLQRPRALS